MQAMKRVRHPSGVDIVFDAKWHQYRLGNTKLQSVSKLLDRYFPFEEERVLALVSRKQQIPAEEIKRQWQRQALLGKNVHEYIECRLLNKPPPTFVLLMEKQRNNRAAAKKGRQEESSHEGCTTMSELLHGEEGLYLPVADAAVDKVKASYDVVGVEQVIAAPDWGIAGTIDFVGLNRRDRRRLLIADWKTSGSVISNFRFGSFEVPSTNCLRHLPNAKFYRYAMQVIIYGEILKRERYIEGGFFDSMLSPVLAIGHGGGDNGSSSSAEKDSPATRGKRQPKPKQQGSPTDPTAAEVLSRLHQGDFELEYGIVQLSKNDAGGVEVEFKEVTEGTVLPPDGAEVSFNALLQKVMMGE